MEALGLTVTVTVNTAPVHEPDVGVTTYAAVTAAVVVLVRLSLIVACVLPDTPPVRPVPRVGTVQA